MNEPTPGQMDMGDIVAGAFGIYRRAPLTWLALTLVSFAATFALQWALGRQVDVNADATNEELSDALPAVGGVLLGGAAADLFTHIALIAAAAAVLRGGSTSVGGAYAHGVRRYLPALLGSLVIAAVVGLLFATVILLPLGIFLLVNWSLLPQVVVVEGEGPLLGLRRSREIVRGQWWRTFGINLAIVLLAFLPGFVIGRLTGNSPLWLVALGAAVATALVRPFVALAQTLLYADLRARKGERPFLTAAQEAP